ncbi:MAG: hypothetical protein JW703_00485 [Candidatus Diapherotrites archaeon]|nr:hypothetical protein [Candidatus Diapherotrites archaeon]
MIKVEKIEENGKLLALIIKGNNYEPGVYFPTTDETPFQIGLHKQPKGKIIPAHRHYPISFENLQFSEFFYIVKGKIKITVYNSKKIKIKDVIVEGGDIIYLLEGHGMELLEETTMFELKQGPYRGKEKDKEMI